MDINNESLSNYVIDQNNKLTCEVFCYKIFTTSQDHCQDLYIGLILPFLHPNTDLTITGTQLKMSTLLKESQGCAILDSGCITTVCGSEWFDLYTSHLSDFQKSSLKEEPSEATFTFGYGRSVKSLKRVCLPCCVSGFEVDIVTDVVD